MEIRAAVVDPLPLYRRGVAASLNDIGLTTEAPDDIRAWTANPGTGLVLLSLCAPADWQLLAELHAGYPDATLLLALIEAPDTEAYLRALDSGALGAIPRASTAEALQQTVAALMNGQVLLPARVMRALVDRQGRDRTDSTTPSPEELTWLRYLAVGSSVAQLAQRAGYSERMMFRKLRALYAKLPARNRTEALMYARDRGWL